MSLIEQITADVKTAMLSRDAVKLSVLRMLQSELKYARIAKSEDLTDDEVMQVIRKEIKKRKDAVKMYTEAGHGERALEEGAEAAVLQAYLPAAIDEETITAFVKKYAEKYETLEPKHKGEIIKATMQEFAGRAEGQQVAEAVNRLF
jgi:uncharacterized protein YqeY